MSDEIDTTTEIWKTIEEFPRYSVSSFGRVRRDAVIRGHAAGLQMAHPNKDGYLRVTLCNAPHRRGLYLARLVAQAFLEPDPNPARDEVNHKNGIKSDCASRNLEWSTRSENIKHSYDVLGRTPLSGEDNGNSKLSRSAVIRIRNLLAQGIPRAAVAAYCDTTTWSVNDIATGRTWCHVP